MTKEEALKLIVYSLAARLRCIANIFPSKYDIPNKIGGIKDAEHLLIKDTYDQVKSYEYPEYVISDIDEVMKELGFGN